MSGIAITIPGSNFSSEFGNVITDLVDVPVTGISIIANDYYVGTKYALGVSLTPSKTSHRECIWSIVSGSEYASIDRSTGIITIFESANMSPVRVKVMSVYDNNIQAQKEINLMYRRAATPNQKTLGALNNVDAEVDLVYDKRKTLVKEVGTGEWKLGDLPIIETRFTEDEVNQMIENGTIDDKTLYFCEE